MQLTVHVRDLLVASWATERRDVERVLPRGLEPAEMNGQYLVSLVGLRHTGGRAGRLPILPFSQLNLRVYTFWEEEPAIFLLDMRVSPAGILGTLRGMPFRISRLRFSTGQASAPGLGVRVRYRPVTTADPGDLGRLELGLLPFGRELRALRIRRGPAVWEEAIATEPVRVDPLLALGFDLKEPSSLYYVAATNFELEVPPRPLGQKE